MGVVPQHGSTGFVRESMAQAEVQIIGLAQAMLRSAERDRRQS